MWRRAAFLDRDGTINVDKPDYVKSVEEFDFLPGAIDALRTLATLQLEIIVVTNQSAIARGLITFETATEINRYMVAQICAGGGRVTQVYMCPHSPDDRCGCRKPMPGLLTRAARDFDLDLRGSFMVGDRGSDVTAAHSAGCYPILICRPGERSREGGELAVRVDDLREAVECIQEHCGCTWPAP